MRAAWIGARSWILIAWFRALYPGLHIGKGVRLGRAVHISVVRGATLTIADKVTIEQACQLVSEGVLTIGADSFVGTGTIIVAVERVTIGRDALIAAYVTIRDQDHCHMIGSEPFHRQGLVTGPIEIGDNAWIATKATILKGVRIGDGAIVASNAVVTSSVAPAIIVGGIPARLIKRLDA